MATPARWPAATLGMVQATAHRVSVAWAGPVPRRVAALLGPPPRSRVLLMAVAVVVVGLAGVCAL